MGPVRRQDAGHDHALRRQRRSNAVHQKSGISVVIDMLELTPSALGKMPARRLGAMWTRNCRAIRLHEIAGGREGYVRSEEHTSELQSLIRISYAVVCWKTKTTYEITTTMRQS